MGLRQGECFGLTVDRVDFLRRTVRVDRQLVSARGGVPEFGPPKSKAGFRTVPIPDVVGSTLAEHLARYGPGPSGLVFVNTLGQPLRRNTAGSMWHRAADCSGLPRWASFHYLRHFHAWLLIDRGCSVKAVVQKRLGHQTVMETLRARTKAAFLRLDRATTSGDDRLGDQHVRKDVDPSLEVASLRGEPGGRPQPSRHGADPRGRADFGVGCVEPLGGRRESDEIPDRDQLIPPIPVCR
jgi:hypothetical protein